MAPAKLKIVSLNILSSRYCSPEVFVKCPPEATTLNYRWPLLQEYLFKTIDESRGQPVIFCLQEVCYPFRELLEVFFRDLDYSFIGNNYSHPESGSMGVAIAFPRPYKLLDLKFLRIADVYDRYFPTEDIPITKESWVSYLYRWWYSTPERAPKIPYDVTTKKVSNVAIFLRLHDPVSDKIFCVADYHAPCRFWDPNVMVISCALGVVEAQKFAKDHPLILAGDFNSMPNSEFYFLLTKGDLPEKSRTDPALEGYFWKLGLTRMRSAYFEAHQEEPKFTLTSHSNARGKLNIFEGTIDYIFASEEWTVGNARLIYSCSTELPPSYIPDKNHPSDHLFLEAEFELN